MIKHARLSKTGKLGRCVDPALANKIICTTFPDCRPGDDMMLLVYCKHGLLEKSAGVGGQTPICKQNDLHNLPLLKIDDMIRSYCMHGWT